MRSEQDQCPHKKRSQRVFSLYLSLSVSLCVFFCLFLPLPVSVSLHLSLSLFLSLCFSHSVSLSLCLFLHIHTKERPSEDTVRRQPNVSQEESSYQDSLVREKPNQPAPWLWTSRPQIYEKINLFVLSHGVCGMLWWQPEMVKTGIYIYQNCIKRFVPCILCKLYLKTKVGKKRGRCSMTSFVPPVGG